MMRTVVVVGTLLLGVGAVMAQQDLVKQTQTVMKAQRQKRRRAGRDGQGRKAL